jgi:hypothetical protein
VIASGLLACDFGPLLCVVGANSSSLANPGCLKWAWELDSRQQSLKPSCAVGLITCVETRAAVVLWLVWVKLGFVQQSQAPSCVSEQHVGKCNMSCLYAFTRRLHTAAASVM